MLKLGIFARISGKILRAYAYIWSKNFGRKASKRTILANKWSFERSLLQKFMQMIKLEDILKGLSGYTLKGSKETMITGLSAHSKSIRPGNLFIAKKRLGEDGRHYIEEAIQAGAAGIVSHSFYPALPHLAQVIHPNVAAIEGHLAANYYQHPSHDLLMVGVTGTKGKTTSSFLIKHLMDRFFGLSGLIGTIEYIVGKDRFPATYTTPEAITNHGLLRQMCLQGCLSAVMEVSSHALDQGRVNQIDFDVAVFTNLSSDHLDYHGTMEKYCQTKQRLFDTLGHEQTRKGRQKWAVINRDSPWMPQIIKGCSASLFSFAIDHAADLQATHLSLEKEGTKARLCYQGQTIDCYWPLIGRFNVYNCLAALSVALTQGISLEEMVHHMATFPSIRGRLEPVPNALGLKIYVDFSHTGEALMNVLSTLKELQKEGRLIVLFGCGGDRDPLRRQQMAEAGEHYADFSWITTDNPRSEDPLKICQEIAQNFRKKECYQIELDRRLAIYRALKMLSPRDTLLIAGRGHERYQIFAYETIPFDDCQIAADLCTQIYAAEGKL